MSIVHIKAEFACDGCGNHFRHALDAGYAPPAGWSLYDIAPAAANVNAAE